MPRKQSGSSGNQPAKSDYAAYQAQQQEVAKLRQQHSDDLLKEVPDEQRAALSSVNKLAVKLFKRHSQKTPGNTAQFPSSIHPVLAMLYAGSRGNTARQLSKAFGLKMDQSFQKGYADLLNAMR